MKPENLTHWLSAKLRWLFETEAEAARRDSSDLEERTRREFEVDRLDRLRNPGNYRGR